MITTAFVVWLIGAPIAAGILFDSATNEGSDVGVWLMAALVWPIGLLFALGFRIRQRLDACTDEEIIVEPEYAEGARSVHLEWEEFEEWVADLRAKRKAKSEAAPIKFQREGMCDAPPQGWAAEMRAALGTDEVQP